MLYQVAVTLKPTKKEKEEEGKLEKLLYGPNEIIARSEQEAAIKILRGNEELNSHPLERLDIIVRPF